MLRVAVVEDEPGCAAQITGYLERFSSENQTEMRITCFQDGMEIAETYRPVYDLIFLDIEMPLLDGMSTAERIRQKDPDVLLVFITNLAQYAIRGYGVNALDYVLKPIRYPAFALKLQKALRILEKREKRWVLLSNGEGESKKIPVSNIRYIEVTNHQLIYHTLDGDFSEFGTLRKLEDSLGEGFARCNHCYLVNLSYVDGTSEDSVLLGADTLKISRAKKKQFMQMLSDYYRFGGR